MSPFRLTLQSDPRLEILRDLCQLEAQLALWRGDPGRALAVVEVFMKRPIDGTNVHYAAPVLVSGMRACADLAERSAARQDSAGAKSARQRADRLSARVVDLPGDPFSSHAEALTARWEQAECEAEESRCRHLSSESRWDSVRAQWQRGGRPHREAYALWRQAEALLQAGQRQPAVELVQRAWQLSSEHVPLRHAVENLARLARVPLEAAPAPTRVTSSQRPERRTLPYQLTARELEVLRLLTDGLTNSQIGARLYMSPKTVSVHISAILRKLGAANRVQAATIAQQAQLTDTMRE